MDRKGMQIMNDGQELRAVAPCVVSCVACDPRSDRGTCVLQLQTIPIQEETEKCEELRTSLGF